MSLKAQTHFNTIHNVRVISPHWLLPPQRLACLRTRTAPPSPPSPLLTLSHPALTILTLAYLPSLRLRSALPALLTILTLVEYPPNMLPTQLTILALTECPPNMLLTQLTILTLVECPPNMLPTPLILTLVALTAGLILNTAYHPCTPALPPISVLTTPYTSEPPLLTILILPAVP
ncbi:hypothetical protein O181_057095 [Austropuccinia psidii MF-1]|uniref:Uncharacterized protein n=1 Tax=Austropuccinia psidii MF-1 TaxID=1389203 RepID=A0A9Q3E7A8_9BASI|nr:hypothetical protein [Austropuccinia psidii MF-1]